MPTDRKADRHREERKGRFFRPEPPDLWDRLAAVVGRKNVGNTISGLIAAYLDGRPMPARPDAEPPPRAVEAPKPRPPVPPAAVPARLGYSKAKQVGKAKG